MFGVLYAQRPFRVYPSVEGYDTMPLPSDAQRSAEWTFARVSQQPRPRHDLVLLLAEFRLDTRAFTGQRSRAWAK